MKNFRKVLALILVVATLFSFVAMASAKTAADYSDVADIKYVEAVDVLSAIGITEGYDGAFHANDPIDRDEVAAMIARLRNGGDVDAALYVGADNVFADVKGQWSEGYVTYCAQLGIINGYNATTFAPDASVKGVEVLKMLLCVLGFDGDIQGYTGSNWQVNVVRDAAKAGLLIDGVDVYAPATRDEVAQYFLNALKSKMVIGYLGEGLIKITNSIWADVVEEDDEYVIEGGVVTPDSIATEYEVTYKNAVISGCYLYESIDGLSVNWTDYDDCYGRPGYVWTLTSGVKTLFSKFYPYAASKVITDGDWDAVEAAAYALTKDDAVSIGNKWTIVMDGKSVNRSTAAAAVGNGVRVELYATQKIAVIVNTYIAKVANVSEYYGTFDLVNADKKVLATFSTGDYAVKAGDVVLYWICDGSKPIHAAANANKYLGYTSYNLGDVNLHDLKVIEAVNVDVTAGDLYRDGNEDVLYASGKEYKYAFNLGQEIAPALGHMTAASVATTANYNLYLDEYGYIMYYAVPAADEDMNYAYLVEGSAWELYTGENNYQKKFSYTADLVNFGEDGALAAAEDAQIDETAYNYASTRYYSDTVMFDNFFDKDEHIGTLISYTHDAKGNFQFVAEAEYAPVGAKLSKNNWEIGGGIYCTSETVFMIRTKGLDGKYSYEQVTGYEALPGTYYADALYYVDENAEKFSPKMGTNIQYFVDAAHPDFASYVFIDAKYQDAEADHFLVLGEINYDRFETALKDVYGDEYNVYDAIVDGERALIATTTPVIPGVMYDEILSALGYTVTVGGETYELYVWVTPDMDNRIGWVDYTYEVKGDEVYVKYTDLKGAHMTKLAKDAKIFTLKSVVDATTGETLMKVEEMIVSAAELALGDSITVRGYIFLNDETPAKATEIYVVTSDFYNYFIAE